MGTVRIKATQAYPYADKSLSAGDVFDASDRDAALLKKVGLAVDADPDAAKPKRQYRRRDLQAEE